MRSWCRSCASSGLISVMGVNKSVLSGGLMSICAIVGNGFNNRTNNETIAKAKTAK